MGKNGSNIKTDKKINKAVKKQVETALQNRKIEIGDNLRQVLMYIATVILLGVIMFIPTLY